MARETQTTRALREHASNLKAPSQRAIRYLRSIIDNRPYTTLSSSVVDINELEELQRVGLWPPQTCNGARKARRTEREELDICGMSAREEKAVGRVVKGALQGRQPELRLDYEDTSIIAKNRWRPVPAAAPSSNRYDPPRKPNPPTDARVKTQPLHTSAKQPHPSTLLIRPLPSPVQPYKQKKHKNNWQYRLAQIGRIEAATRKDNGLLSQLQQPHPSIIETDNRKLACRLTAHQLRPATGPININRETWVAMNRAMKQRNYHEVIRLFNIYSAAAARPTPQCVDMCAEAYLKTGRTLLARIIMEKYRTYHRPVEETMVLQLKSLLARCKVDAAIAFVQMAKDTAKGFGVLLTKTLLEGLCKIGVNSDLLLRTFDFVESLLPTSQAIHYTILIRGYTQNKQFELASEWFHKMQTVGHKPDSKTYNIILSAAAQNGRWDEIQPILELFRISSVKPSSQTMNEILNAAAVNPDSSLDDLHQLAEKLGAPWTTQTWNVMLKATIVRTPKEDQETQIRAFFDRMSDAGTHPDPATATTLVTYLENSGHSSPSCLRRLLGDIHEDTALQSPISDNRELRKSMLHHASSKTTTKVIRKDADILTVPAIATRMAACLRENRPIDALVLFHHVLSQSIRPTTDILILTVKALFMLPSQPRNLPRTPADQAEASFDDAQYRAFTIDRVLDLSARHGLAVHLELSPRAWKFLSAVYSYRLSKRDPRAIRTISGAPGKEILFEIYRFYEKHDLRNPHHPLMVAASIMHSRRQHHTIIELMRGVAGSPWGNKPPLCIVALTILLKAYVALQDAAGVRWVAEHVIERQLEPDEVFLKVMSGQRKVPIAQFSVKWGANSQAVVDESVMLCRKLKARIEERRERGSRLIKDVLRKEEAADDRPLDPGEMLLPSPV
ncbi:hypothetical protein Dda_7378 [Drechslerella dactyloides]|uniref:Pentatricopeptide repeat protein n=1 Tax=Drechslerella dactyloides TaxID=74499 RepID=A0AAD6IS96_DREDA|nr:hypothetical protein Dda_7378 [Drechslerella dactyloides]